MTRVMAMGHGDYHGVSSSRLTKAKELLSRVQGSILAPAPKTARVHKGLNPKPDEALATETLNPKPSTLTPKP